MADCTCRKAIYVSRTEALQNAKRYTGGLRVRAYMCPCDPHYWHLTSYTKRKRRVV